MDLFCVTVLFVSMLVSFYGNSYIAWYCRLLVVWVIVAYVYIYLVFVYCACNYTHIILNKYYKKVWGGGGGVVVMVLHYKQTGRGF